MRLHLFFLFLLLVPLVHASEGSIPLLAVSETANGLIGSMASLDLEIREGKGRVFLETSPVIKADTQISMRFAQQIACYEAEIDCSVYDFIYTIDADSGIIGGPSAGSAAAALTYALLTGEDIRSGVGVTGTINSGGLIGPVGGLSHKIDAAHDHNFSVVLIPLGTRSLEENNQTIDLVAYGKQLGITVVEVSTLSDILRVLTGRKQPEQQTLKLDPLYVSAMQNIALDLCERSKQLAQQFYESDGAITSSHLTLENQTIALEQQGQAALRSGDYYSAASFCFRTSVNYEYLRVQGENLTSKDVLTRARLIQTSVDKFRAVVSRPPPTINALQSSIVVLDRLDETEEYLKALGKTNGTEHAYLLSFANERLHSAVVWSRFYSLPSPRYLVDVPTLALACTRKLQEAQERYQYVQFYLPNSLENVRLGIEKSLLYQRDRDYARCLFTAAQAKSEANTLVGVIGADSKQLPAILSAKLSAIERVIGTSTAHGFFPIIGYSYYQYATTLKDSDPTSALLFAEQALEFSNLDLYFPSTPPSYSSLRWLALALVLVALVLLIKP